MPQDRRDQLLEHLLRRADNAKPAPEALDQALLSRIVTGLVFAQRPINAAGSAVTERYSLGPRGAFILSLIDKGIEYPKDLALVLRIGRSLVTAELVRLTDAGLIAAQTGDDRRRSLLRLTPLGSKVTAEFRTRVTDLVQTRLAAFSRDQVELFATMLLQMQEDPAA
ncbi:MarR family winged helix-turn-helix transcriptional regulator [Novosphingobium piscinae]|uniref:Winged helix-turn-helix transcriptional regulator n=1 Tax=Novosphingobium piscinae TaxID=1507448 RepID=A0A7X1FVL8_9SPHN|nr:MarR family winged helix-turn-helix transcriptional regulator [Novosphingobium piscinae]MBC2667819.1 winged helix-turn-helix transcriptional regulator [Novosphingobium piscinae]